MSAILITLTNHNRQGFGLTPDWLRMCEIFQPIKKPSNPEITFGTQLKTSPMPALVFLMIKSLPLQCFLQNRNSSLFSWMCFSES